jgi:hypothetical protein
VYLLSLASSPISKQSQASLNSEVIVFQLYKLKFAIISSCLWDVFFKVRKNIQLNQIKNKENFLSLVNKKAE